MEGLPIAVKDNIDILGTPTTAGSPALLRHEPRVESRLWTELKGLGAVFGGKTNMDEMAYGTLTNNAYFGRAMNPKDIARTCGGSSGGSAGAVAAGIMPVALGTDSAGSIRIPASCTGIIGFKPTKNRWHSDNYGIKLSNLRDSVGPLLTSLDDLLYLDHLLTEEEPFQDLLP